MEGEGEAPSGDLSREEGEAPLGASFGVNNARSGADMHLDRRGSSDRSYAAVTSAPPRRSHTAGNEKGVDPWSLSAQIKRRNYAVVRGNRKEGSNSSLKGG